MSTRRSLVPGVALGWAVRSIAVLAAAVGLLAGPADATIAVYASSDGVNRGELELDTVAADQLDLWIYKGADPSPTVCDEDGGSGDAICGYHVLIEVQGFGYIANFVPDSGDVVYHPSVFTSDTMQLEASSIDVSPSGTPVPVRIGTLTVDATGGTDSDSTSVLVQGQNIVAANLALEDIPPDTIAATPVPEPGEILLLASGIAGLAGLHRLRKGSPSAG